MGGGGGVGGARVFLRLVLCLFVLSLFSFMHASLHFRLVSFMLAHLRMLSFVFSSCLCFR